MKTIFDHIEYVKGQPHHIRKKVVFATAGGMTAVIALVWFVGTLSSGVFAIQGSNFADSTGAESATATGDTTSNNAGLAGAGAAVESDPNAPAHIEIIDSSPVANSTKKAQPTVIPF